MNYHRAYAGNPLDALSGAEDFLRTYSPITLVAGVLMAAFGWTFTKGRIADIFVLGGAGTALVSAYYLFLSFGAPQLVNKDAPLASIGEKIQKIANPKTKQQSSVIPTQPTAIPIQKLKDRIIKVDTSKPRYKFLVINGKLQKVPA